MDFDEVVAQAPGCTGPVGPAAHFDIPEGWSGSMEIIDTWGVTGCAETTCEGEYYFCKYRQSLWIGDCELAKKCFSKVFQGNISCLDAYLCVTATDGWDGCSCE